MKQQNTERTTTMAMTAFLRGFRDAAHLSMQDASEQWAAFSRQVSDAERRRIEQRGYGRGIREGRRWAAMYADELAADDQENAK